MNQRTTDGDLAAVTSGQRIACLAVPPPPPPIGFPVAEHRQFDSAWNMFGAAEDFEDLGFMDAEADFGIFGSFPNQQTYFDLQMSGDGLNDFPLLNVGEIANHDPAPVRSSFCAQSSSLHEMSPSSTEIRSMVPSSSPYSGDFGFQVAVAKQLKTTKSASWVFFERINKLFVMKDKPCPFLFKASRSPPSGSVIRVLPIYPTADHVTEIVTRCPTHACERKNQEDPILAQHLIISEHHLAEHVQDAYSNRLNVIIPYEDPQVGAEWVTSLFQFKCLGSCQKINDRRSWQVLFTLESPRGSVLGRQVVLVHCCSSPGRDGLREEQKRFGAVATPPPPPPAAAAAAAKKNFVTTAMLRDSVAPSVLPKFDRGADGDGIYALRIRGRERFELLLKIRDSLQLSASVDKSAFDKFRQKLRQMDELVKQEPQRGSSTAIKKTLIGRVNSASKKVKKKRFESGAAEHDSGCRDNEAFRHQPFNI